ncbi:MAG TPA: transglutaminase-like domain-containing protein [Verrucomicrobiae bacterium]|nr:transglutaminase-like domain-containing protein [Verrucomicrobiae bacterium]
MSCWSWAAGAIVVGVVVGGPWAWGSTGASGGVGDGGVSDGRRGAFSEEEIETVREVLRPENIRHEEGFCHIASLGLGREGDKEGRSLCVLMEDGKEVGPARAPHADIRARGMGRYSHWTSGQIYFSAGDNSDPRVNGREYALVSRERIARHTFAREVSAAETAYGIEATVDRPIRNRRLIIRNLDPRVAVAPHLTVEGWPDLASVEGMLASILSPDMTAEQRAIAIWRFLVDWRYHYYPAEEGDEVHDPVKFINVYGYGFCDDSALNFAVLCRAAGLRARFWGLEGHVVGEAFFDGGWHMFDPDHEVFYRAADGRIVGVEELAANPGLITARATDPIGSDSASIARLYTTTENNRPHEGAVMGGARLDPVLYPGDEVIFDLGERAMARRVAFRDQPLPPMLGNGRLVRQISVKGEGNHAEVRVDWPYVILGGELSLDLSVAGAPIAVSISDRGDPFTSIRTEVRGMSLVANLGDWLGGRKAAPYGYVLRLASGDGRRLENVIRGGWLTTRFQFAPRALPQIRPGATPFHLRLFAPGGGPLPGDWRGVEVIQEWDEIIGAP